MVVSAFTVPLVSSTEYGFTLENSATGENSDLLDDPWFGIMSPSGSDNSPAENSPDILDNSLVGYWKFDEGSEATASNEVSGAPDLTLTGDATWTVGNVGPHALKTGGSGNAQGPADTLQATSAFTIVGWVRPDSLSPDRDSVWVGRYCAMDGAGEFRGSVLPDGRLGFDARSTSGRCAIVSTGPHVTAGTWSHVALVYDGPNAGMAIYADGNPAPATLGGTPGGMVEVSGFPFTVGGDLASPWWSAWNGAVDEVQVYNHALSPPDIWKLYLEWAENVPPTSMVNPIDPHWHGSVPFEITATVTGGAFGVQLWYSYSPDNSDSSWGPWTLYGTDNAASWSWSFDPPAGDGYYKFYSVAVDQAGNFEPAPDVADAGAFVAVGLVGYWSFDENEGNVVYNRAPGVDGTIYGATRAPGRVGSALSFDGDDYVEFPATVYGETPELTAVFWVRARFSDMERAIMAKAWAPNIPGVWLASGGVGSGVSFTVITEQGRGTLYSTSVLDNDWTHVALRYDGENMKIYLNGVEDASDNHSGMLSPTPDSFFVGRSGRDTANMWIGEVDEVRIYTRALSADEIEGLYLAEGGIVPLSSSVDPIEPYWRNEVPFTMAATTGGTVENVELWYCHSPDNLTWGAWENFGFGSPIGDNKWSWSFTAPENDGYYEFYSIAVGSREEAPKDENGNIVADARAGVDTMPPSSVTLQFEGDDYWKELETIGSDSFTVNAVAVDGLSGVEDVELWYRYSLDNWTDDVAWKKRGWQLCPVDASLQSTDSPLDDDFAGTALDPVKWENASWGDGEASLLFGNSEMTIKAESSNGSIYNLVYSKESYSYGSLEVRARVPGWELDSGSENVVWFGFVDNAGNPMVGVTFNASGTGLWFLTRVWNDLTLSNLTSRFDPRDDHLYRIVWMSGETRLYVDGENVATHTASVPSIPLRVAFSARSSGTGDVAKLVLDYVRVRPAYRAEWEFTPPNYGYYEFFTRAVDAAGNLEPEPGQGWVQSGREDFEAGELENLVVDEAGVRLSHRVAYEDNFDSYADGYFPSAEGWELVQGENGLSYVTYHGYTSAPNSFRVLGKTGYPTVVQKPIPTDVDLIGYEARVLGHGGENQGFGFFDPETLTYYAFLSVEDYKNPRFDGHALGYIDYPWYKVKVLLDKKAGKADVWLNGDKVLEGVTVEGANQIKAFCLLNEVDNNLQIDDIRLFAGYVSSGTLTSSVHDAGGWASWGEISWEGTQPQGTEIVLQTRTGSVLTPDDGWSSWSDNYTDPNGEAITSPGARYIQYRATLETENLSLTPELHEVCIAKPEADAGVRVADDVVRVAVILAEPSDVENRYPYDKGWYQTNAFQPLTQYYDEVSYGALAVRLEGEDVYDSGGEWYELKPYNDYLYFCSPHNAWTYNNQFSIDAINAADGDVDYSKYKAVVMIGAFSSSGLFAHAGGADYALNQVTTDAGELAYNPIFVSEEHVAPFAYSGAITLPHELGHALGKILVGEHLPDLNGGAGSWGDVGMWGLMDRRADWPIHLSSWSKARLGWLGYDSTYLTNYSNYLGYQTVQVLPTLGYGGLAPRYQVHTWELDWWWTLIPGVGLYKVLADVREGQIWYVSEARNLSGQYSEWDTSVPDNGLVVYKVEWTRRVIGGVSEYITVPNGNRAYKLNESCIAGEGRGARFTPASVSFDPIYTVTTRVEYPYSRSKRFVMYQIPYRWEASGETMVLPDLDLHAYTPDGKHVGVNYSTGAYEIEISGALASGDVFNGSEWISVPENLEVYFVVSSRDAEEFIKSSAGTILENGMYAFEFYYTNAGGTYASPTQGQIVPAGVETFHELKITEMPDGTCSVTVEPGTYLFDLIVWKAAVDNIPDNAFIKNPAQRKNALKEKFEEVFEELDEAEEELRENEAEEANEHYWEAIEKLTNDILKKLDADGQADWVKEQTLVDELSAFIGMLKHKAGAGGEDIE